MSHHHIPETLPITPPIPTRAALVCEFIHQVGTWYIIETLAGGSVVTPEQRSFMMRHLQLMRS
jgi:hypothetical protein